MGMFDNIKSEYPLPGLDDPTGFEFQTKSFDSFLDDYKIDVNGQLLIEDYDVEDRSDPNAEGFARFIGCATRIPKGWKPVDFTGDVSFYGDRNTGALFLVNPSEGTVKKLDDEGNQVEVEPAEWFEYNATFEQGTLLSLERLEEVWVKKENI